MKTTNYKQKYPRQNYVDPVDPAGKLPGQGLKAANECVAEMQRSADQLCEHGLSPAAKTELAASLMGKATLLGRLLSAATSAPGEAWSPGLFLHSLLEDYRARHRLHRFRLAMSGAPASDAVGGSLLQLAFSLLLENALRCAPTGTEISVGVHFDPEAQAWTYTFADMGPGIEPQWLPLVFEDPRQVGPAALYGFGVTLAHCLVEAAGGTLSVKSGIGGGASFQVSLPLVLPLRRWIVPQPKVLIIDRDPQVRTSLAQSLTDAGYIVKTAVYAEDGLQKARTFSPQLIVLEHELVCSEQALLDQCRTQSDAPVVLIGKFADKATIADALWQGAADFLPKPFDIRELLARVKAILRRRQPLPNLEVALPQSSLLAAHNSSLSKTLLQ
jgi:CheY-like chemotaxis protein